MTGRLRTTLTLLLSLGAGSAYALAAQDAGEAGWTPLVMMLGDGDRETSLAALRGLSHAYAAALHRTEVDQATQRFHDHHAAIALRFREIPEVHIEGAALGFLPTGLIDAFVPGNIEGITRDFLHVAATGRGGRGAAGEVKLGVLAADSDEVQQDAKRFAADLHAAFQRGLAALRTPPGDGRAVT